jgi:chromosome segregation ATPase
MLIGIGAAAGQLFEKYVGHAVFGEEWARSAALSASERERRLEMQIHTLIEEREDASVEAARFRRAFAQAQGRARSLEAEARGLRRTVNALYASSGTAEEVQALRQQVRALQEAAELANPQAGERERALEKQLRTVLKQRESASVEAGRLRQNFAEAQGRLGTLEAELAFARSEVRASKGFAGDMRRRVDLVEQELSGARKDIDRLKAALAAADSARDDARGQITTLQKEIAALKGAN